MAKSAVFNFRRNAGSDWISLTEVGREFQARDASDGNARSPMVARRVCGTTSFNVEADRRRNRQALRNGHWRHQGHNTLFHTTLVRGSPEGECGLLPKYFTNWVTKCRAYYLQYLMPAALCWWAKNKCYFSSLVFLLSRPTTRTRSIFALTN